MRRREFNRHAALAAAGFAWMRGQEIMKAAQVPVALVKGAERKDAITTAIESLGEIDCQGMDVYLKGDFNSAYPYPASTHPETIVNIVQFLREGRCARIVLIERSGMGLTREVWQRLGLPALAKRLGVTLLPLEDLPPEEWRHEELPGSHWKRGVEVPRFLVPNAFLVQLCNLKTHRFGGQFSASLKNSIGLVAKYAQSGSRYNYMAELHASADQRLMIAEVSQIFTPAFVIMDAVQVFIEGGPEKGELAHPEVIAASRDRVALDALGVALLRLHGAGSPIARNPVFEQDQLKRAAELKLGVKSGEEIHFVTADQKSSNVALQVMGILGQEAEGKKS